MKVSYEVVIDIYDLLGEIQCYNWAPSMKRDIKLYRKLLASYIDAEEKN